MCHIFRDLLKQSRIGGRGSMCQHRQFTLDTFSIDTIPIPVIKNVTTLLYLRTYFDFTEWTHVKFHYTRANGRFPTDSLLS